MDPQGKKKGGVHPRGRRGRKRGRNREE